MQPVGIMAKTMANFFKWMIIKGSLDKEMHELFDEISAEHIANFDK